MQTDRGIMDSDRERVIEEQVPGPDGVRTYLSTKAPLRDAAGTIIGLVGVARDITDRVRSHAEREALLNRERVALLEARAARDSLESVLNRIAEGFVALDRGWRYTYVNPKAAALFGREPASLIGRHIWTEFPEGIGQPFHLAYERAMATQQPQTFEQYYEPWAQWYVNRVYPSPDGVSIFFEDITAAKAREAEAHAHQAHLTAVLAATPLAVITYDLAGRITGWHGAAERIFGWSAEEVVGRSSPLFSADYPEEQDLLAERIRSGVAWSGRETMRLRKDGRTIPVSIWTANLCDRDGAIIGGVGTYEDISPRWLAEQERERLVADLRDLSRHLESVREEERLRIAREIHDQLGQTLTGLRLEVDWLAQHAGHGLPTEAEHLDRVATVTTELLGSVRRIAQELRPPLLDDLGLAEALDYHLQEFGARTGLECEFDAPDLDPALDGATATGLYRVAQEALTNVVRHAQAHRVTVRLSAGVDGVRLSVADDGRGFDPAGARIQRTLGLVGMRERLAALGGELRVVSAPGAGTVVTALIPRPAAATAA
jgi:PAS domain S-box-containing protein